MFLEINSVFARHRCTCCANFLSIRREIVYYSVWERKFSENCATEGLEILWKRLATKSVNLHLVNLGFSDRASWIDYTLITNLMHWLLFIHKILFSSKSFESQVLIFRRIQLYTWSIWYCHSLWEFLVACRYTAWVRTDCRGKGCW